ncbi:amidohydrolase family protein [Kutzneria sp. NPDC052558]|uniref:amidohydrolase family protein n=1 Tax=Kutzneria sp. NPDC052558 TaxID=3364121 RepID=UPI0037CAF82F
MAHVTLLGGAVLDTGARADVLLVDGLIDAVGEPGSIGRGERVDLDGYLLLPAPAEPHAHLDKALTLLAAPNPRGDLAGAIEAWRRHSPTMRHEQIVARATEAALLALAHGATALRSHVDVNPDVGLRCLRALIEVREALRGRLDLQLVALAGFPMTGEAGSANRRLLREALELGADVVGACPYLDPDPVECHRICLAAATEFAVPVDLHTDETIDESVLTLPTFARLVTDTGFVHGAVASHCVSLGVQPPEVTAKVAAEVAEAGLGVVCLPQTNLYLQARDRRSSPPRGLTALAALTAAGVTVAGGGDNVQDPFNQAGRGDPLETAALLVAAGHLLPADAYAAVSRSARAVMGLPSVQVAPGFPAELLAIRARSVGEAVAGASADRIVFHRGRMVSRTTVRREFPPLDGA